MLTLIVFLFVLSVLIIAHEFGHFIIARKMGVRVEKFSLGFGPRVWVKKGKETEYTISAIPLGGYVKMAGDNLEEYKGKPDEYFSKSPKARAAIVFFGPLLNYILGFLCFWVVFFAGYPTPTSKVGSVIDGSGAKEAGIQVGDKVVAIDGKSIAYFEELQEIVRNKKPLEVVKLSILRGNKEQTVNVTIKEQQLNDILGQKRRVGLLGIGVDYSDFVKVRHGFFKSFILSAQKTYDITTLTLKSLLRMITGKLSMRESVTGPLGIYMITAKVAAQGLVALLNFIGLLSVSLGIFNLLPLPILDGGHILLLGIEKIRGRSLSLKTDQIITRIGFAIIISLVLVVTYNDLLKFGNKLIPWLK